MLVEAGADVNAKTDDKATARCLAAAANHESIQQLLLEHGAENEVFDYLDGSAQSGEKGW